MPYADLYKGRHSQPGYYYHITTVTHLRQPIFAEFPAGRIVVKELMALDADKLTHTLCYMLMPDHLHWLMQLRNQDLGRIMKRLKVRTARHIGGTIWQERYYEHALRKEADIRQLARYIIANPLRKGLVTNIGDYPFWDAIWL